MSSERKIVEYKDKWFSAVGLLQPKRETNVWGVVRGCWIYDVSMLAIQWSRYHNQATDTNKTFRKMPILQEINLRDVIPYDCVPVAVDLCEWAVSMIDYEHPKRAFYIFWPEDWTLGRNITDRCRDVIYIPWNFCMNLASCVNVVLYDRMSKQLQAMVKYEE